MRSTIRLSAGFGLVLTASLLLGGCQTAGVTEWLDRDSGLTLATDRVPAAFARTDSRVSRSARDYVYVGPVEVNERGSRQYYLWVGIASTVDRDHIPDPPGPPDFLYFDVDGAPLELPLDSWSERLPRLEGRTVYHPVIEPALVLAARVTLDQLDLIRQAAPDGLRLAEEGQPSLEYVRWSDGTLWPAFVDYAEPNPGR